MRERERERERELGSRWKAHIIFTTLFLGEVTATATFFGRSHRSIWTCCEQNWAKCLIRIGDHTENITTYQNKLYVVNSVTAVRKMTAVRFLLWHKTYTTQTLSLSGRLSQMDLCVPNNSSVTYRLFTLSLVLLPHWISPLFCATSLVLDYE